MNTIQKIFSLLIGLSLITAIPHSCKDDDESSAIEEAAKEIQKIQKQVDELAKALSDEEAASQSLEKAAQSLKEATESAAEARQKLEDAVKALLEAAKALKEDQEKSGTAGEIESAATELQETAEQRRWTKEEAQKKFESVSKKLQQAKDMMIPPEKLVDIPDKYFYDFLKKIVPQAAKEGQKLDINSRAVTTRKKICMGWRCESINDSVKSFEGLEYFTALQELKITEVTPLNDTITLVNKAVTYIAISGSADEHLKTLDINGCINLKKLVIFNNPLLTDINLKSCIKLDSLSIIYNKELTSLDLSHSTALEYLDCRNINLTSLDLSHSTALEYLDCRNINLTSLDLSHNNALEYLDCEANQLKNLDVSKNTKLKYLYCSDNPLTTNLDLSNNTALTELYCEANQLKNLDVSKNTKLKYLDCRDNPLTTNLDLSNNTALTKLYCEANQLKNLDVSKNTKLKYLDCSDNPLTTNLDLSHNTALEELKCEDNQLTKLDVSHNHELNRLVCYYNHLKVLDLRHNPKLYKEFVYADKGVKIIMYGTKKTKTTKKPEAAKKSKVVIKTIEELYAPIKVPDFKGTTKTSLMESFEVINHFTKFDFATGKQVAENSDEWDVAFAGQFVIINGGQKIQACTKAAKSALKETASALSTTLSCTVDAAQPERTGNAAAFMFDYTSFDKVKDVKDVKWRQDTAKEQAIEEKDITETMQSDPKGFFEFSLSPPAYTLIPFKNATAVFRTRDGKHYVKMQALNCYKGQPKPAKVPSMSPNFGYWTFKYYYNPVENDTSLDTSAP